MSKIKTALNILFSKNVALGPAIFYLLRKWKILNICNDKLFVNIGYYLTFGTKLNLSNPQTFNQKLNWLKIYNRNPEYTHYVDKYRVKEFVSKKIGKEYIIPTLGVWDKVNSIEWNKLPNEFVIKCTHDSRSYIICKDKSKLDVESVSRSLALNMKRNLYWWAREWPYKNVIPQIIAEPFLKDSEYEDLKDYKFFCFGGKVKCFKIDFDRFSTHGANYYDVNGNILDIGEVACPPNPSRDIHMPNTISKMVDLAETLSEGIPFLRVDFYDVNGHIYFGEMTFFPAEGFGRFISFDADIKMGSWIHL